MNRRGFIRALSVATAAGASLPTLEKLDFLVRQPTTVIMPGEQFWIDWETKTIGVHSGPMRTIQELYDWVSEQADEFKNLVFPAPMLPTTPHLYKMENNYVIGENYFRFLKGGSVQQKRDGREEIWSVLRL